MRMRSRAALLAATAGLFVCAGARADEFKLKDGSKITGTIVGFENGTFKVQTSYGYALVDKDKIAEIIPANTLAKPRDSKAADKSAKPASETASATEKEKTAAVTSNGLPAATATPNAADVKPAAVAASPSAPASGASNSTAPSSAPAASAMPAPPAPEPIHESVDGTLYVNQTFGFRLYKPPSWDLIPDARSALESAVAALGTFDETTLMVIAREPLQGTAEKHADATQRRVSTAYENFRITGTRAGMVAGLPSNERHYRGAIDGHDWSGVIVTFARGTDVYTILGATRAESDLVQIQENVIARTIASLQFDEAATRHE